MHRGPNMRPTSIFEAPFVQLLMRLGHFIFTLRHAGACRCVRTTVPCRSFLPAVFPGPIRSRVCKSDMRRYGRTRRSRRAETREERFFQNTSADANNRQKNNNCFYSRENTSPKPASCCRQGRSAVSSTSAKAKHLLTKLKVR